MLFDFSQASLSSQSWQVVNDDVMGGISASQFKISAGGTAVFSGNVSLENNGGFASVRSEPSRHDLSGRSEFGLRVRGDGRRYKFTVRTEPRFDSPLYQCAFSTMAGEWTEHRLAFDAFIPTLRGRILPAAGPLDPTQVRSVGFLIADKQVGAFRLEIAFICALTEGQSIPRSLTDRGNRLSCS